MREAQAHREAARHRRAGRAARPRRSPRSGRAIATMRRIVRATPAWRLLPGQLTPNFALREFGCNDGMRVRRRPHARAGADEAPGDGAREAARGAARAGAGARGQPAAAPELGVPHEGVQRARRRRRGLRAHARLRGRPPRPARRHPRPPPRRTCGPSSRAASATTRRSTSCTATSTRTSAATAGRGDSPVRCVARTARHRRRPAPSTVPRRRGIGRLRGSLVTCAPGAADRRRGDGARAGGRAVPRVAAACRSRAFASRGRSTPSSASATGFAARFPLQPGDVDATRQWLSAEAAAARELPGRTRFPTPEPVALGEPGPGYPLPWSVQTWLPGSRRHR